MNLLSELVRSVRGLLSQSKRRRSTSRFAARGDGLEPRQLMTVIVPGGFESEPNNGRGQHNEISVSVASTAVSSRVNGHLTARGDTQDVYKMDLLDSVTNGTFQLSGLRANLNLEIQDTEGRVLATAQRRGTVAERIQLGNMAAGTYFIRIFRGGAAGSVYTCTFNGNRASASRQPAAAAGQSAGDSEPNNSRLLASYPGALSEGGSVEVDGSLAKKDPHDWYCISLPTGGTLTVELNNISADLDLEIQDASGRTLAISDYGGTTAEQIRLQNLSAGDYYVRVHQFGRSISGYKLSAALQRAAAADDLQANDSQGEAQRIAGLQPGASTITHGSISASDRQDWYQISVPTGGSITAELSGLTDDLDLEVRDSSGRILGTSTNGSTIGERLSLQTLAPGDYYVRIYGYGRANSPWQLSTTVVPTGFLDVESNNRRIHAASVGNLSIAASESGTAAAAPVSRLIQGSLNADPVDWYRFQISRESEITADFAGGPAGTGTPTQLRSGRLAAGNYCLRVTKDASLANFVLTLTDDAGRELSRVLQAVSADSSYTISLASVTA